MNDNNTTALILLLKISTLNNIMNDKNYDNGISNLNIPRYIFS